MKIKIFDAGVRKNLASGYGLASKYIGLYLKEAGHDVHYYDQSPTGECDLWLWVRPPHYIDQPEFDEKAKNIFYTMHESETFEGRKSNWIGLLNRCDAVVVPTDWNRDVFVRSGLTKPCHVVPLGVDTKVYHGAKTYEYSILTVHEGFGRSSSRENWRETLEAYYTTFYNNHNKEVMMTVKTWKNERQGFDGVKEHFCNSKGYDPHLLPPVQVIDINISPDDMNNLYSRYWTFIKNSDREGWCLPALEAISCNVKVISKQLPSMPYLTDKNTDFFRNSEELSTLMWEHWRRYVKVRGHLNLWRWSEAVKKLQEILNQYVQV